MASVRRSALAPFLVSVGLAFPVLAFAQVRVNPESAVATIDGDQTEPAIAINPNDANHLAVAFIDIPASDCKARVSSDGGATWSGGVAMNKMGYVNCTDPSIAFDAQGNIYMAGFLHNGRFGFNDFDSRIGVARSNAATRGGAFENPVLIEGGAYGTNAVDKPYVTVDTTGGLFDGRVYVAWNTSFPVPNDVMCGDTDRDDVLDTCPRLIKIAALTDLGTTIAATRTLSQHLAPNDFGAVPAVGPEGEVYVVWRRFHEGTVRTFPVVSPAPPWHEVNKLLVAKSIDGGMNWGPVELRSTEYLIADIGPVGGGGGGMQRASRYPMVVVSRGGGTRGTVHVALFDEPRTSELFALPSRLLATGPPSTRAFGINRFGSIVGEYFGDQDDTEQELGRLNGFLLLPSRVESDDPNIPNDPDCSPGGDCPDASRDSAKRIALWKNFATKAMGINDVGQIVGKFDDEEGEHGFLLDGDAFTTAVGQRIGDTLVGPSFRTINVLGAQSTRANGINNHGDIVGGFIDGEGLHGYLQRGTVVTTIDAPGATQTEAFGINDRNEIVGCFHDTAGLEHGFLRSPDGQFTAVDFPGAIETCAAGINNSGRMVGKYDAGTPVATSGFVRHPDGTYARVVTAFDLTEVLAARVTGISNADELVGFVVARREGVTGDFSFTAELASTHNVYVTRSDDRGETWTRPIRVNDVIGGDQYFPWMCGTRDGRLHLVWLDRRDDPANLLYHAYQAHSSDGGQTFSINTRLTTVASNPRLADLRDRNGNGFIGDYIGIACGENDIAAAVWPDMRDGERNQSIYSASVSCGLTDNGDGTITDTCTKLMWLKDANYARTTGVSADGTMRWTNAMNWADGLQFGGYADWRLPKSKFPDLNCRPGATPFIGVNCTGSELAQLFHLGRVSLGSPGPFTNIGERGFYYWTQSEFSTQRAWILRMDTAEMGSGNKESDVLSWPVRDLKPTDTSTGANVTVRPDPNVTITFTNVSTGGSTTVVASEVNPGPATFQFLGKFYDIRTTAVFTSPVTVCLSYSDADLPAGTLETDLRLRHLEGGVWVDVTVSHDLNANIICGQVSSFSWFAVSAPLPNRPPMVDAGAAQLVECTQHTGANVRLVAAATDPDGDPLSYEWRNSAGTLVGTTTAIDLVVALGTHTFSVTVRDGRGGVASDFVEATVRDSTAPSLTLLQTTVSLVLPSPDGASVDVLAATGASAVDACDPSPVLAPAGPATYPAGTHHVIVSATDASGNRTTADVRIDVVYRFDGFAPPLRGDGQLVVRGNRTLPIKFQLFAADGSPILDAVATLGLARISDAILGTVEEFIPDAAGGSNTGNLFRVDLLSGQYIYNLSTGTLMAGTYVATAIVSDGTQYSVRFSVR
ncbi:MAG: DUF1566 domain-containing protein [Vicinamibacterales bacterium]